jgi:hypothetical protein
MKRIIALLVMFIVVLNASGQTKSFIQLMNEAKEEFNKEFEQQDYAHAIDLLTKAVKLHPENSEAHYFLGYAYSRLNSKDGTNMYEMSLDLTLKSSEQFEIVNKLAPKYIGEFLILDPYSKITAEWGSMAMSYWHNNKQDSARWAFNQGKQRGGFSNYFLSINRTMLDACSPNSILISSGDNFTIPLWYLQIVEKYRIDVSVIDISLLNTIWYPAVLLKNNIVAFDLPKNDLDSLKYVPWKDTTITINHFSWVVKPSYYEHYLLRGDQVFMSLLRQNNLKRNLYFTTFFSEDSRLSLKDYLVTYPLVDKFSIDKKDSLTFERYKTEITKVLKLSSLVNLNSHDELIFIDGFRSVIMNKINDLLMADYKKEAKEVFAILDALANETKIPFQNEHGNAYMKYLRKVL